MKVVSNQRLYIHVFFRDGTCCDICIPMPGCVNGKCRKEMVNGEEVEIAQTCDCDKWPADLGTALADKPQYTGAKCDMRKYKTSSLGYIRMCSFKIL